MTRAIAKLFLFITLIQVHISFASQTPQLPENASLQEIYEFVLKQKFSDPEGAHTNAELLLQKGEAEQNLEFIFKAYYQLARIANIQGDHKTGIIYADKAIIAAKNTKNTVFLSKALLTKGNGYVYLGDDETSLKYYLEALTYAKKSNNIESQIIARGNIAKIKRNAHLDEEALRMFQENFALCKQYGFEKQTIGINAFLGLTGTFLTLKQPDSTLFYAQSGIVYASANKDEEGESYFYIDMGIAHYMKSEFTKAITSLKKAEEITLQLKNKKRLVEVYYYIGKSYFGLEDYSKAVEFLELTKKTVSQENKTQNTLKFIPHILLKTHELLAELYKKQGEFEKSSISFEQYKILDKQKDIDRTNVYETLLDNAQQENQELTSSESRLKIL
jgi:tetratricopeptide (TPR) repeat protein